MSDFIAEDEPDLAGGETLTAVLGPEVEGERLDRALALTFPALSRARIQALMAEGAVRLAGQPALNLSLKARGGVEVKIDVPTPLSANPEPEDLPLDVLFEDAHLIVINKAPGMAAHPAPGTPDGTLVNALLFHCGASLSGIGGVARPGIVHRLDKDTSGVMVAAKTDRAHQGLSALFAAHDIERTYIALTRGAPDPARATITTRIGRAPFDRKKMAVLRPNARESAGREAITHYRLERAFGPAIRPTAARVACTLETGRTHQIRVHMAFKGTPVLGDALYGSSPPAAPVRAAMAAAGLDRQALHAAVLGFVHPVTGESLRFETLLPPDMAALEAGLAALP